MSQAVLMSIKPEWLLKILPGDKTIEMRKSSPAQLNPPFTVYVYCTEPNTTDPKKHIETHVYDDDGNHKIYPCNGKVMGWFICDVITKYPDVDCCIANTLETLAMIGRDEARKYANGKTLYGWHISDFRIFDKPKELSEFKRWNRTEDNSPCAHVKFLYEPCESCKECNLTRPPQSWCYVEELQ